MRRHRLPSILLLAALLLFVSAGCSLTSEDANTQPQPVSYEVLSSSAVQMNQLNQGQHSTFEEQNNIVVRTQSDFEELWTEQLYGHRSSPPPVPEVSFDEKIVVVAILGPRNTGGYQVTISGVERTENGVRINVTEEEPGSQCQVLQVMTSPYVVAELTSAEGEITFQSSVETRSCD